MGTVPIVVIAVCVVVLGALVILRGASALKGEIPKSVGILIVVLAVLVAGVILYKVTTASPAAAAGGEPQMMMGQEGMGAGGGMGAGPGGMGGPNPHRDLGQLVRKLVLLKSQDANAITAEQSAKLLPVLQALATVEGMTVEEAEAKKAELEALLTPDQTAALAAIELPRPTWGGGAPGGGAPPPGSAAPGGGDRRAAMRARMLETPCVKKLYDEQVAADPEFATDDAKQGEFFRGLRSQLSPFLRGSSQEALQELIKGLSPAQ